MSTLTMSHNPTAATTTATIVAGSTGTTVATAGLATAGGGALLTTGSTGGATLAGGLGASMTGAPLVVLSIPSVSLSLGDGPAARAYQSLQGDRDQAVATDNVGIQIVHQGVAPAVTLALFGLQASRAASNWLGIGTADSPATGAGASVASTGSSAQMVSGGVAAPDPDELAKPAKPQVLPGRPLDHGTQRESTPPSMAPTPSGTTASTAHDQTGPTERPSRAHTGARTDSNSRGHIMHSDQAGRDAAGGDAPIEGTVMSPDERATADAIERASNAWGEVKAEVARTLQQIQNEGVPDAVLGETEKLRHNRDLVEKLSLVIEVDPNQIKLRKGEDAITITFNPDNGHLTVVKLFDGNEVFLGECPLGEETWPNGDDILTDALDTAREGIEHFVSFEANLATYTPDAAARDAAEAAEIGKQAEALAEALGRRGLNIMDLLEQSGHRPSAAPRPAQPSSLPKPNGK